MSQSKNNQHASWAQLESRSGFGETVAVVVGNMNLEADEWLHQREADFT